MGPCQPDQLQSYYQLQQPNGVTHERRWLCYSPRASTAYCETCWLFGNPKSTWAIGCSTTKREGWARKIKEHETSDSHKKAHKLRVIFKAQPIEEALAKTLSNEEKKWADLISRLVDVILAVASMNIGLRGHREAVGDGECCGGNFLTILNLVAKRDSFLQDIIAMPKGSQKYLSPTVQNELVSILADETRSALVSQILSTPFFSLVLDSTQDMSKIDQLSIVIRSVATNGGTVKIEESFLGFIPMKSGKAQNIAETALKFLKINGLPIEKLRGQGYDGASVMSGLYNGVQALLKQDLSNPVPFVHCATHNLCLVTADAAKTNVHMVDFFNILAQIYAFVGGSYLRWEDLKVEQPDGLTIKALSVTRWSSRHASVRAVKTRHRDLIRVLTRIDLSGKKEEAATARGLLNRLRSFEFTLTLLLWEKILLKVQKISNLLQTKDIDLTAVTKALESLVNHLDRMEIEWDGLVEEARCQAKFSGGDENFTLTVQNSLYRYTGRARGADVDELTKEERFKLNIFLPTLHNCKQQVLL